MNCDESLILISGHLDGTNTEAEEKSLREHLETCEDCRRLLRQMEENDRLLRESKAEVPADLKDRIMKEVRGGRKSKKPFYISVAASGLAVAAMLTLVFVGRGPKNVGNIPTAGAEPETAAAAEENAATEAANFQVAEYRGAREREKMPVLVIYGAKPEDLEELEQEEAMSQEELAPYMECAEQIEAGYELPRARLLDIAKEYESLFDMTANFSSEEFFRSAVLLLAE